MPDTADDHARIERDSRKLIRELTGFIGSEYESINGHPFKFFGDDGSYSDGVVSFHHVTPDGVLVIVADGGPEIIWERQFGTGDVRPALYSRSCRIAVGTFVLNQRSHIYR